MKVKEQLRCIGKGLGWPATIVGTILAFELAYLGILTTLRTPLEFAQKKLFNEKKQTYVATLKDRGYYQLAQTKGVLLHGDFELENGEVRRIHDSARVLEGKLLDNSRMPSRTNIGQEYKITTIGSKTLGYSLLKAREL